MYRKSKRYAQIFILLISFFLSNTVSAADGNPALDSYDNKIRSKSFVLDSIKAELRDGRKKILQLKEKEGTEMEQLEQLKKNLTASEQYLEKITEEVVIVTDKVGELEFSLDSANTELEKRREKMKKRLRSMYMTNNTGLIQILFTSANIKNALNRGRYFLSLKRYDQNLLDRITEARNYIEIKRDSLKSEKDHLETMKSSKEEEKQKLVIEENEREEILENIMNEREAYEAKVKELEKAQQKLQNLIMTLLEKKKTLKIELERKKEIAFEKRKGKLSWPVDGTIVKKFGKIVHPVYKTVIKNNGVDIQSVPGTQVLSVAPGSIEYIGWMRGYGNFIIVNHFGGYISLYSHLDNIRVSKGDDIEFGKILGEVAGRTNEKPIMHFQIRKEASPLNPEEWLSKPE